MSLEQEGYQWYNDDGSQASATTKASQDAGISVGLDIPVRLRTLVNQSASAVATSAWRLEYKEQAASDYSPVNTSGSNIIMALSSNITTGGEATTARMSTPSGKVAADFATGRLWDDENGNDTVTMGSASNFTEMEWCIQANSSVASLSQVYSFRVTRLPFVGIAFDAVSSGGITANSVLTISHTVSGSNRLLIVGVDFVDAIAGTATISSVTYNGAAMTFVTGTAAIGTLGVYDIGTSLYSLIAPDTGTHDIVITMSESCDGIVGGGQSYTGAHQTTPTANGTSDGGSSSQPTLDVTSAAGEIVVALVLAVDDVGAFASADTPRWQLGGGVGQIVYAGSEAPGAGTVTMNFTGGAPAGAQWAMSGASLKPL